jgi:UDP-N-acetylmuramate: L-alanyl-gamma-D-glutamyl-meso-diaminopimelate ligase
MELHTFSSLNAAFLPEYAGSMDAADVAYVYYNPKTIEHKQLERIEKEAVVAAFQRKDLHVFTDSASLMQALRSLHYKESNLLMMSSGNFDGTDLQSLANEITQSTC